MKKRVTILFLVFAMVLGMVAPVTSLAAPKGWNFIDGYWYYYYSTKYYFKDCKEEIGGSYYWFDANGRMQTGWIQKTEGGETVWYYAEDSGALVKEWKKIGCVWYYFSPYGYQMWSGGIYSIDGEDYYFADSGAMLTGWIKWNYSYSDGTTGTLWYYAKSDGALVSEWNKINGVWYYFSPSAFFMYADGWEEIDGSTYYFYPNGAMATGWIKEEQKSDGFTWVTWFYANSSGELLSGWQNIGGVWYYFDDYAFYMYIGAHEIGGKFYVFQSNGAWVSKAGWVKVVYETGYYDWFYLDASAHPLTEWQWLGNAWYYFYPDDGFMLESTTEEIDGKLYAFDDGGALISTAGWHKLQPQGEKPVWVYTNASGVAKTKWHSDGGKWYYLHPETGYMVTGGISLGGTLALFDSSGAFTGYYKTPGWKWADPYWYYIMSDGTTATGWKTLGSAKYYFDPTYAYMYDDGFYEISGKMYSFAAGGALQFGWIKLTDSNGYVDWYYANTSSGALMTGWLTYNGEKYYLDKEYYYMYSNGVYYIEENGKNYYFDENGACKGAVS